MVVVGAEFRAQPRSEQTDGGEEADVGVNEGKCFGLMMFGVEGW
jgi:hypothetical protein